MSRRRLIYLHGFASSAHSSKGTYLAARATAAGMLCESPDLNEPDFSTLTITRMVDQVRSHLGAATGPVTLIGSSLGAVVALFAAEALAGDGGTPSPVDSLVLMAPAVDLVPGLSRFFGPAGLAEWERTDRFDVFHYGDQAMRSLRWSFFADARNYDPWRVPVPVPALVFQGTRDEVVECGAVERWASGRPGVMLRLLDDGHQLLNSLEVMWDEIRRFLPESA